MFPIVVDIELLVRLALGHHQIVLHHECHRDRHRHRRSNKVIIIYGPFWYQLWPIIYGL